MLRWRKKDRRNGSRYAHEWTSVAEEAGVVALAFEDEINLLYVGLEIDFCDWDASNLPAAGWRRRDGWGLERTLYAGDDERREGGIGDDNERGERPEILSVEQKTLYFAEPPSSRTELHYEWRQVVFGCEAGIGA